MKKSLYILFILLGAIVFSSCEEETFTTTFDEPELKEEVGEGYVDLTISMNVPSLNVDSRTLESDPKNQEGSWTNWEKFVDGALLYRVTLFVIDGSNKLVAYRNFYSESPDVKDETDAMGANGFCTVTTSNNEKSATVNTDATIGIAVKATFNSTNPMHGVIEKLQPGDYKIIAVANYAPITASDTDLFTEDETKMTYDGLGSVAEDDGNNNGLGGDFTTIVNNILEGFNTNSGLSEFSQTGTNGSSFFTYKLNSGTDRVCKQLPQPLVMIREVTLKSGKNQVSGLLSRTFARVRLEVRRENTDDVFSVHDLSFANSYASQNAYLFNDVSAGNTNLYDHFKLFGTINEDGTVSGENATAGPLNVNSSDCIIPSSGYTFYDKTTTSYPLVDCYILEGKVMADYAFSFIATYWDSATGGTATENYKIAAFTNFLGGKEGDEQMTGLSVVNVYIHDESVGTDQNVSENSLSHYLLYADTENIYSTNGEMKTSVYIDNVSSSAKLDPEYIWRINLTEKEGYPKYANFKTDDNGDITNGTANPGIGIVYGNLVSIGSNLYLQPYDGNVTPKLGTEPAELIFRIDFTGNCEVGTIFCKVGSTYYYLDSDSNHSLQWNEYKGNVDIVNETSTKLNYLTFSTINGSQGTTTNVPIQKPILINSDGESTGYNEIVRNDFYYGIIPISL